MRLFAPVLLFLGFSSIFAGFFIYEDYNCKELQFFWERDDLNISHLVRRILMTVTLALVSTIIALLVGCCAEKEDETDTDECMFMWKLGSRPGSMELYTPARSEPSSFSSAAV